MTDPNEAAKAAQAEKDRQTIAAFVIRARRVEAQSLAADQEALVRQARGGMEYLPNEDGTFTLTMRFPPEEQLESAAARVRPFLLSDELVYCHKVLKALKNFVKASASQQAKDMYERLRTDWKSFDSKSEEHRGYLMQMMDTSHGGDVSKMLSDNVLGFAWIYGDTVHADPEHLAKTEDFGVEHRFKAAVPLVAQLMVTTINTLNLVRFLVDEGVLAGLEDAFVEPVVVTKTEFVYSKVQIFTAPVDESRPHPDMGQPLSPEWQPFDASQLTVASPTDESGASASTERPPGLPQPESEQPRPAERSEQPAGD